MGCHFYRGEMSQPELLDLPFTDFQQQASASFFAPMLRDGQMKGFASILPPVLTIKCDAPL